MKRGKTMNISSIVVVLAVVALAGFAVWRNVKKGAPCSCGEDCECCKGGGDCHCGG